MKNAIEFYVEYATIYYENLLIGNSKISNKMAKLLSKMNKDIMKAGNYSEIVDKLLENENVGVKYWISSVALLTNYRRTEAVKILLDMSKDKNIGVMSIMAYMGIEECKKRGWIK